jgi:uncharacterized protein (TIGR00725 family)
MNKKVVIGVMGKGDGADGAEMEAAERLGELIAEKGWVLLNGGRAVGVMEASARGAKRRRGLTIGILPHENDRGVDVSEYIDIPIFTGMGYARNVINVLSSDVVIACAGGLGTTSEVALALSSGKPVIFLGYEHGELFSNAQPDKPAIEAHSPEEAIEMAEKILAEKSANTK